MIGVSVWLLYQRKVRQSKNSLPQWAGGLVVDQKVVEIQGSDEPRESERNAAVELE
jgi:hypothetical protein